MTTKLACLQDFAIRDAADIRVKLAKAGRKIQGVPSSRDWAIAFSIHKFGEGLLDQPFSGNVNNNFPAAIARVDFGRWVAECPFCNTSCMVDPDDPFFFCMTCAGNKSGDACPCTFPNDRDRDAIETELLKRPVIKVGRHPSRADEAKNSPPLYHGLARNWNPGETIADLKRQRTDVEKIYASRRRVN